MTATVYRNIYMAYVYLYGWYMITGLTRMVAGADLFPRTSVSERQCTMGSHVVLGFFNTLSRKLPFSIQEVPHRV